MSKVAPLKENLQVFLLFILQFYRTIYIGKFMPKLNCTMFVPFKV